MDHEEECLLCHHKFVAKSENARRGPQQPAWKAGTLPAELLPQIRAYFSPKLGVSSRGPLLYQLYARADGRSDKTAKLTVLALCKLILPHRR